jgi:hypothetical protein
MAYFVVRVQTPDQELQVLLFTLNKHENLMEQVVAKVGTQFTVLSINLLGVDWPM